MIGGVLARSNAAFVVAREQAETEIAADVMANYGATPAEYHAEVMRLIQIRLRSIGLLDAAAVG